MPTTTLPPWLMEAAPAAVIARCPVCKFTRRDQRPRVRKSETRINLRTGERETSWRTLWLVGGHASEHPEYLPCPNGCAKHGQRVSLFPQPVIGRVSEKKCGARCLNAVGPSCECQCGGENHGGAYDA